MEEINVERKDEKETPKGSDPSDIVPQLKSQNITFGELKTAVRVLQAVATLNRRKNGKKRKKNEIDGNTGNKNGGGDESQQQGDEEEPEDGLELYKQSNLRPLRKALAGCLELHRRTMFGGKDEEEFYQQRILERRLKRQKLAETDMQKKHIELTKLRKGRVEKLQKLQEEAKGEELKKIAYLVPDGHVETDQTMLLENGDPNDSSKPSDAAAASIEDSGGDSSVGGVRLPKLRSCYVCKLRYRDLHHFYDQLCPACAALNWEKRRQTADLSGKVAVVTGSRVKIGYQTCLKLLRAGCTVVATTRFPNSAVEVYKREADFSSFKDRLQVYGLDLRDVAGLEAFTRFLKMQPYCQEHGIDILINNACQTIRRPAGYYAPMIENEQKIWKEADDTHKMLLEGCSQFERLRRKILLDHKNHSGRKQLEGGLVNPQMEEPNSGDTNDNKEACSSAIVTTVAESDSHGITFDKTGLSHAAAMSQMIILPEDAGVNDDILPRGLSDINGQQLDLRKTNSWLLRLEEVSTPEIMECMFVNAIAPFVLNSRLKPLMSIPNNDSRPDRYIINVSAMEGKFYRFKTERHPHTNMAKAALNMLTRTSADDLAKTHRIYMNSVDTGWINDENPLEKASKIAQNNQFQTPIDEIDAAARILDPIFSGVNGKEQLYGKFLKDYRETEW